MQSQQQNTNDHYLQSKFALFIFTELAEGNDNASITQTLINQRLDRRVVEELIQNVYFQSAEL